MDNPTSPPVCQVPSPLPLVIPGGGISLLAGAPSIGKTALIAGLSRLILDLKPIFGRDTAPIPAVGFVNADRGWADGAGVWFSRAGVPTACYDITPQLATFIRYYSLADDDTFQPQRLRKKWERTNLLFEFIDKLQLPRGSLVIVDPIALFLGGNLLDYDTCACACHEIRRHLRSRGLTMLATAHSSKLRADKKDRYLRLQDQILGSTALFGFTDTQMYLAGPAELGKDYYAFLWQPHLIPPETFTLERNDQGLFVPYTGADLATEAKVFALFPADGSEVAFGTIVELAEAVPLKRRQVKTVLERLLEAEKIEHVRHGMYRRVTVQ